MHRHGATLGGAADANADPLLVARADDRVLPVAEGVTLRRPPSTTHENGITIRPAAASPAAAAPVAAMPHPSPANKESRRRRSIYPPLQPREQFLLPCLFANHGTFKAKAGRGRFLIRKARNLSTTAIQLEGLPATEICLRSLRRFAIPFETIVDRLVLDTPWPQSYGAARRMNPPFGSHHSQSGRCCRGSVS